MVELNTMKTILSAILIALLSAALCAAPAECAEASEVYLFTGYDRGNMVDYAHVDGWTVMNAQPGVNSIAGVRDGSDETEALVDGDQLGFVPCGDKIAYYGPDSRGKWNWQLLKPGGKPVTLPLSLADSIIWGDADEIWYYNAPGRTNNVYSINHSGKNKKKVGTADGTMIGRLYDGAVLTVDFNKNAVYAWNKSKSTTLYKSDDQILNVSTAGERIWVMHDGYFGLLEDGELAFTLPGYVVKSAFAGDETVMLVDETLDGASMLRVFAALDNIERLIELGDFPSVFNPHIALMDDGSVVIKHDSAPTFIAELSSDLPYWNYQGEYLYNDSEGIGEDIFDIDTAGDAMSDEEWRSFLRGSWHADTAVGSGYDKRMIFTDIMCAMIPSQYEDDDSELMIAYWSVVDGELNINYGGEVIALSLSWYIAEDEFYAITINEATLYKMSDEPEYYYDLEDYGIVIYDEEILEFEEGD